MNNHSCCGQSKCGCGKKSKTNNSKNPVLFKFSGTLVGGEAPTAFPCDLADAGLGQCIHEGTVSAGLPYPTYPAAVPFTLSSLSVDMQSPAQIGETESPIFFQLLRDDQPVGAQISFTELNLGHNVQTVSFPGVTWQPGQRLTLRSSCLRATVPPEVTMLGISATAGGG